MNVSTYFKSIIISSLLIILSSSSFFYPQYIKQKIAMNTLNSKDIRFAVKHLQLPVISHVFSKTLRFSDDWLRYAYILANEQGDIAFELAQYFTLAVQAKNTTTLEVNRFKQQHEYWLNRAVELQYIPAIAPLAMLFSAQGNYEKAQSLLKLHYSETALLELALTLAIDEGDKVLINSLSLKVSNIAALLPLQEKIKLYVITAQASIESSSEYKINDIHSDEVCINSIQFYATNLADLQKAEHLIKHVAVHPLARNFCFFSPRYITLSDLSCTHQYTDVIQCNEDEWPEYIKNSKAKYLTILLPKGGANVHNGIMYLDSGDTVGVFAHELSHFLGFVDEYPLITGHNFCKAEYLNQAPNIVVLPRYWLGEKATVRKKIVAQLPWKNLIKARTPILKKINLSALLLKEQVRLIQWIKESEYTKYDLWELGTFENKTKLVGVYPSLTCENNRYSNSDNIPLQSFKPLSESTSLEYFELTFPQPYSKIIERNAVDFSMGGFNLN